MSTKYYLTNLDQSVLLFELPFLYKTEEPSIIDLDFAFKLKRDLRTEDIIRNFYARYAGRNVSSSSPIELLRILLAQGFNLETKNDDGWSTLAKDHFPLRFQAKSDDSLIPIGEFYRTSTLTPDEIFPHFCRWLDELCGFRGMARISMLQYIDANFSIYAIEPDKETVLVRSLNGEITSIQEETLVFLTDEQAD